MELGIFFVLFAILPKLVILSKYLSACKYFFETFNELIEAGWLNLVGYPSKFSNNMEKVTVTNFFC